MSKLNIHATRARDQELANLLADSGLVGPDITPDLMEYYQRRGRRMRAEAAHELAQHVAGAAKAVWRHLFTPATTAEPCGKGRVL